jgi:voltage-gated potassium channel
MYRHLEGWSWLDSFYVTMITITTVGYGDLSPQTPQGRIFAIFFTFIAIGVAGYAITSMAAYLIESREAKKIKRLRKQRMQRIEDLQDHYIICGSDLVGTRIAEEFYLAGAQFVIIDDDEKRLKHTLLFVHPVYSQQKVESFVNISDIDLSEYEDLSLAEISEMVNTPYILESPTKDLALIKAGIGRATGLIAAMPNTPDNLAVVVGARALAKRDGNENLRIMARVDQGNYLSKMYLAGADAARIPAIVSGVEMAMHMMNPEIGNWWYSLTGINKSSSSHIKPIRLSDRPEWVGETTVSLYQKEGVMAMSVKLDGEFLSPPPPDHSFTVEDIIITLSNPKND